MKHSRVGCWPIDDDIITLRAIVAHNAGGGKAPRLNGVNARYLFQFVANAVRAIGLVKDHLHIIVKERQCIAERLLQ